MQFSKAILIVPSLALAVAANALPEKFSTQACGNPMSAICPKGVALANHACTLSCMNAACVKYDCGDGTYVVCGKNQDSCTKVKENTAT